jgi:hypothetical protein
MGSLALNWAIMWLLIVSTKIFKRKGSKPDLMYNYEFQNLVLSLIQIMAEKDKVYQEALNQINLITELIDKELDTK